MAVPPPSKPLLRTIALVAGVLAASAPAAPAHAASAATKCNEDIQVASDGLAANLRENTTELRQVVITACDIRVEADRARSTGMDFENSSWTFDGDVHIQVENRGSLRSDKAVVDFRNNQISRATITGSPAEFEQKLTGKEGTARGRAGEIIYDVGPGTVTFADDAWLLYENFETRGQKLAYNIRDEVVTNVREPEGRKPGADDRVRFTITPKTAPKPPANEAPRSP